MEYLDHYHPIFHTQNKNKKPIGCYLYLPIEACYLLSLTSLQIHKRNYDHSTWLEEEEGTREGKREEREREREGANGLGYPKHYPSPYFIEYEGSHGKLLICPKAFMGFPIRKIRWHLKPSPSKKLPM